MPTLAVLPVKGFAAAKGRLAARLEPAQRAELAEAMLGDVLDALADALAIQAVVVVTGEPRAATVATGANAMVLDDTEETGQSRAAAMGVAEALRRGCERVLLVPGDTPLLSGNDIDRLVGLPSSAPSVAIVPDRHGSGTNALLLSPPNAIAPSFGPDSCARHVAACEQAGVESSIERVPGLEHDIDTPEDLDALAVRLRDAGPRVARRTQDTAALSLPTGT